MARSKLKPCARRRTRISKRNRRADLGCKRAGVSLEMREESVAMHRQGGLSSTEIVNVWQTRGVNIPSRTVRYWCSKLVQRPVGNPSVTTPEKFQARLDHSRDLTGDSPSKKIQKEALYQCGKEKFIAQGGNSLGWLKLREEQPISRWTAWRYSRDAELGQVSARARAPKRDEHGRSLRNPVAEFLQYDSLDTFIAFLTKNGVYTPLTIKVWTRCPLDLMVMSARFV